MIDQKIQRSLWVKFQIFVHQSLMWFWIINYRWMHPSLYRHSFIFKPKYSVLKKRAQILCWRIQQWRLFFIKRHETVTNLLKIDPHGSCSLIIPIFSLTQIRRLLISLQNDLANTGLIKECFFIDRDGIKSIDGLSFNPFSGPLDPCLVDQISTAMNQAQAEWIGVLINAQGVLPQTLSFMCQRMELDSRIAMVGTSLWSSLGLALESGRSIERDAEVYPIKNHCSLTFNFIHTSREVDAVSLQGVMIRKSFLKSTQDSRRCDAHDSTLFYFSEHLAMHARDKGWFVYYDATGGVLIPSSDRYDKMSHSLQKAQAQHNFFTKWRATLTRDYSLGLSWIERVSQSERHLPWVIRSQHAQSSIRRILYVSTIPTHPANHGNRERARIIAQLLKSEGYEIHFVLLADISNFAEGFQAMQTVWDSFHVIPCQTLSLTSTAQNSMDIWFSVHTGPILRALCEHLAIDSVMLTYLFQSKIFDYLPAYLYKAIDSHDKMTQRRQMLSLMNMTTHTFSCEAWQEARYLARADVVLTMSEEEAEYFNTITKLNHAYAVSYCISSQFIRKKYHGLKTVGFVASANRINYQSLLKLIDELARVTQVHPEFRIQLHVVGGVGQYFKHQRKYASKKYAWIKFLGYLKELRPFYEQMDALLSPMEYGTGANIKTIEALSYGVPLLTTARGMRGVVSSDLRHQYSSISELVLGIYELQQHPNELNRLARMSEQIYTKFFQIHSGRFYDLLRHPRLEHVS